MTKKQPSWMFGTPRSKPTRGGIPEAVKVEDLYLSEGVPSKTFCISRANHISFYLLERGFHGVIPEYAIDVEGNSTPGPAIKRWRVFVKQNRSSLREDDPDRNETHSPEYQWQEEIIHGRLFGESGSVEPIANRIASIVLR